jgi:ADP-heptose:LPS heptosyltransferase
MWEKVHFREDLFVPESSSAIVIDCTRNGYGDAICAAWISEYHKKSDRKVLLHATGNMKRVAESLGQTVVDKTGSMFSLNSTWSADSASRLNSDRLATWCSMLGLDLKWSRPSICIPSEELIAAESFRTPGRKLAMICPRSTHTQREWPKQYWNELKQILQSEGFDVVTFGVDGEYVDVLPSVGKSWTLCAAVAKVCDIVIGIDSAPIHWCGTANAKCLAIMGPTTDGVFAHMSNVHCISVAKRQMPCVGCWMYGPYHDSMACNISCSAMSNVLPGEVAGAVMELCNV